MPNFFQTFAAAIRSLATHTLESGAPLVIAVICGWLTSEPATAGKETSTLPFEQIEGSFSNPADLVFFKGHFVWTEVYRHRLGYARDLGTPAPHYLRSGQLPAPFNAPHYLATRADNELLISNGWGTSIVSIAELDGSGWKEFSGGDELGFNAPHGICVDHEGWIYVADSLNSRLVRFKDMEGSQWQVFEDHDKHIAYGRQLDCTDDGVWLANSYERREGLNPGKGGNILRISDFESGRSEIVVTVPQSNLTAVAAVASDTAALALWGSYRLPAYGGPLTENDPTIMRGSKAFNLGVPYSLQVDRRNNRLLLVFLGELANSEHSNRGGLLSLDLSVINRLIAP